MSTVAVTALFLSFLVPFAFGAPALDSSSLMKNGADAQDLNHQFASLNKSDFCQGTDIACVEGSFAQCVSGKWETTDCASGTECVAVPLVNKPGTSITCDTQTDAEARISSTGVSGGLTGFSSSSLAAISASGYNSTQIPDPMNGADISGGANDTGTGLDMPTSAADNSGSTSNCTEDATLTVTVTEFTTASSAVVPASATLAPGFTLPPPPDANAAVDSSSASSTATSSRAVSLTTSAPPLSSTDSGVLPTDAVNTTLTLSPASASAFLSSLSAVDPSLSVITLSSTYTATSASPANAAVETSGSTSSSPLSLSLFTTSPTASPTESLASLAAAPTAAGYGYRVREVPRGF